MTGHLLQRSSNQGSAKNLTSTRASLSDKNEILEPIFLYHCDRFFWRLLLKVIQREYELMKREEWDHIEVQGSTLPDERKPPRRPRLWGNLRRFVVRQNAKT